MIVREVLPEENNRYNQKVNHIIQSWQWGEFRQKEGKSVIRLGLFSDQNLISGFQLTLHQTPLLSSTIGYLPKCSLPNKEVIEALVEFGKKAGVVFIKIEPDTRAEKRSSLTFKRFVASPKIVKSQKPIFAAHTFLVNLQENEEQLLAKMHPKTRYNIKLSQKSGVIVEEKDDNQSFAVFLKLQRQTAYKQGFYVHPDSYYQLMWSILKPAQMAHLLIASYKDEPLAAWVLFRFKDTLYYPYGGSATEHRELMASNLMAWEAIRLGKRLGCKTFDFWGALGPQANPNDSWYGFHRFKSGYGGELVSYVGAYDLVIDPIKYRFLTSLDRARWLVLKTVSRLRRF